jgi:hypothetical protein
MSKDLGKGGIIIAVVAGAALIGGVAYFGFFKGAGYSAEDQARNEAQTKISDERNNMMREAEKANALDPNAPAPMTPEQAARGGQ